MSKKLKEEKLTFTSLDDVLAHLETSAKGVERDVGNYRHQLKELTGHNPDSPVTALDVVKIVKKVFKI